MQAKAEQYLEKFVTLSGGMSIDMHLMYAALML